MPAPPIKYISTLPDPSAHQLVRIKRTVPIGGVNQKRKCDIIKLTDESDPEAIIRTIVSYHEACQHGKLNITSGADRFAYMPNCFGGVATSNWEVVLGEVAARTLPGFNDACRAMIGKCVETTYVHDQKEALNTTKKPQHMGVKAFNNRQTHIILHMALLPGAPPPGTAIYKEDKWKLIFERSMPSLVK
jgi:hypothetical protein